MTLLTITTEYAMTPFEFLGGFAMAVTFILLLVIAGLKEENKELKKKMQEIQYGSHQQK